MTAAEILNACLETGSEAAWTAFVQRFQPLIAASVSRVARRYGTPSPALIDDLIQETYLRLCKNNCRSLREFRAYHDEAIFGYLKVIAASVSLDYFRARSTHKRRSEVGEDGSSGEASTPPSTIEQAALLKQLERQLDTTESERDRTIFWLYYRHGYTTKAIASMPGMGLTQKGVESSIYRLTQSLRRVVSGIGSTETSAEKGYAVPKTLGVVK